MNDSFNHKNIEYIIVGQGICGTLLAYYLQQHKKNILVFDNPKKKTASKVASGVINPITGRRLVRTWMIETIMPFAVNTYQQLEQHLQTSLISQTNVLDFYATAQMQNAHHNKLIQESKYLKNNQHNWSAYFNYHFEVGEINPCYLVQIKQLIQVYQQKLLKENKLIVQNIIPEKIVESYPNATIIFCDGVAVTNNSYFNALPFANNKGEALIVSIPGLPNNKIYKQGISIVPWEKDLWWVGSSYQWNFENELPTLEFRKKTESQLQQFLKVPFTVLDHLASIRPANTERRPFVGKHPLYQNIAILNGMGTKGCSLAPYFAHQLLQHLLHQMPIHAMADVQRFKHLFT